MTKKYIEREELVNNLKQFAPEHVTPLIVNLIQKQSTADVVEVRHSYWQCSNVRMLSRDITCKYCHRTETISNGSEDFEYCPHCGAKMDGKD